MELVIGAIDTGALVTIAAGPIDGGREVLYVALTTYALKLAEVELLNVSVPRKLNPVSPREFTSASPYGTGLEMRKAQLPEVGNGGRALANEADKMKKTAIIFLR